MAREDIKYDLVYMLTCLAQDLTGETKGEIIDLIPKLEKSELPATTKELGIKALKIAYDMLQRGSPGRGSIVEASIIFFALYNAVHREDPAPLQELRCFINKEP